MNKNVKTIILTSVILTVICAVSTALLGLTNKLTAGRIEMLAKKAETDAMRRVISAENFETGSIELDGKEYQYHTARDSAGEIMGYIFTVAENGYGGPVKVMTGIKPSGEIAAIEVLDAANETPGLGQKATQSSFWKLFEGKSGKLETSKSASQDGQIEAMTGATITSKAVVNAVNKATRLFEGITKGDGQNG